MSANTVMTPAEIQKAAEDLNKQIAANEFKLVEQVRGWFETEKQTTYDTINQGIIKNTAANIENYTFWVGVKTYDPQKLSLSSTVPRNRAYDVIWRESYNQCKLIGAFITAQGHNLTSVNTKLYQPYGISDTDINCIFTFGSDNPNKKK